MNRSNFPFKFVELRAHSFCEQEHFPFALHFALPDVNRLHSRKDLHASGQPPGDEHLSDAPGFYPSKDGKDMHKLDSQYLKQQRALAERRVREAGHRLADLLNRTLASAP